MDDFGQISHLSSQERWTVNDQDRIEVHSNASQSGGMGRLVDWVKGKTSLCTVFSVMSRSLDSSAKVQHAKQAESLMNLKNSVQQQSNHYQKSTGRLARIVDGILHGGTVSKQEKTVVDKAYEKLRENFFGDRTIVDSASNGENIKGQEKKIVDQTFRTLTAQYPTESEFQALEEVILLDKDSEATDEEVLQEWYQTYAEQGYPAAQFRLGQLMEQTGDKPEVARDLYRSAAEKGVTNAQIRLADAYQIGDSTLKVDKDSDQAHQYMVKAQQDDRMFLGAMENRYYGEIEGVTPRSAAALTGIHHVHKTTEDASLRGRAALTLAFDALSNNAYTDAIGYANEAIQEGYFQAVDTLVKAARTRNDFDVGELDGTPEQRKMLLAGRVYEQGIGVTADPMLAENFYVKAAGLDGEEEGSSQALQALATRNLEAGNYEFAAQAYQRLVKQGYEKFRLPLLRLHALGFAEEAPNIPGTTKDVDEMLVVCQQRVEYRRAVKQGSAQAAAHLMRLEGEERLQVNDSIKPEEVVAFSQLIGKAQKDLDAELTEVVQATDTNVLTAYEVLQKSVDLRMGEGYVKSEALGELNEQGELPIGDFLAHLKIQGEKEQAENTVALLRQVYAAPSEKAKNEALTIGAQLLLGVNQPEESHKLLVEKLLRQANTTQTDTTWGGPQDPVQQKRWAFLDTVMRNLDSYLDNPDAEVEGIFRLSPDLSKANILQEKIKNNEPDALRKEISIKDQEAAILASSVMKKELEEMHLVPVEQRQDWIDLAKFSTSMKDGDAALYQEMQERIAQLPQENREMLTRIISWVRDFGSNSERTKMPASNLARMFGPRLLPPPKDAGSDQVMDYTKYANKIFDLLLTPPVASNVLEDTAEPLVDESIGR